MGAGDLLDAFDAWDN